MFCTIAYSTLKTFYIFIKGFLKIKYFKYNLNKNQKYGIKMNNELGPQYKSLSSNLFQLSSIIRKFNPKTLIYAYAITFSIYWTTLKALNMWALLILRPKKQMIVLDAAWVTAASK